MKAKVIGEVRINATPNFTLFDIQMGVGGEEFKKGKKLYDDGKVGKLEAEYYGVSSLVSGTHDYNVNVEYKHFDRGNCSCYLGQKDVLCKHMVALAIACSYKYRPEDAKIVEHPLDQAVCSGQVRDISKEELASIKKEITSALRYLKSYDGPPKTWFTYQDSLIKGSRLLLYTLSKLPVCKKSADVCIDLIIRIDSKMANTGIDDSDGTVGDLVFQILELLSLFKEEVPELKAYVIDKFPKKTNFEWEKELFQI